MGDATNLADDEARPGSAGGRRLRRLGGGPGGAAFGGAFGAAGRPAVARALHLLRHTPADADGAVPGTPFTWAGVARLMEVLRRRARQDGAPGARAAGRLLSFLVLDGAPDGPLDSGGGSGQALAGGVSLERLQRIARMAEGGGDAPPGRRDAPDAPGTSGGPGRT